MMQAEKEISIEELHGDLGRIFNFTLEDLEANRAGSITTRQKEASGKRFRWNFRVAFLVFLLLCNFWAYVFIQMNFPSIDIENISLPLLCFASALGSQILLLCWAIVGILKYQFNSNRDLNEAQIEKIAGQIKIKGNRQPSIYIGDKEMSYRQAFHNYPWGELTYTIYYLPRTGEILSLEAIDFEER